MSSFKYTLGWMLRAFYVLGIFKISWACREGITWTESFFLVFVCFLKTCHWDCFSASLQARGYSRYVDSSYIEKEASTSEQGLILALKWKMWKLKSHLLSVIVCVLGQLILKGRSSLEELLVAVEKFIVNYSAEPPPLSLSSHQQFGLYKMCITAYICIPCQSNDVEFKQLPFTHAAAR